MENNEKTPHDSQNEALILYESESGLKTVQNLLIAGAVLCPASVFLPAGLFLSIAGIVCSGIALSKISQLRRLNPDYESKLKHIRIMALISLALNIVTFALNAAVIWFTYPIVLNALETGDFSALGFDSGATGTSNGSGNGTAGGGSTWG